jgi:hypothetical protein
MKVDIWKIKQIIGEDAYTNRALSLILRSSKNGFIEVDDPEIALVLCNSNLAFPLNSIGDSLSWNSRIISTGRYEMPYIIRELFNEMSRKGNADVREVITTYFKKIGERRGEDFFKIFEKIVHESEKGLICGGTIAKISEEFGRDGGVVISELKGAGLISPVSGCGNSFLKYGKKFESPVYQTNKLLAEIFMNFTNDDETITTRGKKSKKKKLD